MSILDVSNVAILGPCLVELDGAKYWSENDIQITRTVATKARDPKGSFGSKFDATLTDVTAEITLTPSLWTSLDKMFAILALRPGARVFGNTDKPCVITSMTEGIRYTYSRAAIVTPPSIGAGVEKDLLGQMTIRALKANATELSAANSLVALTTGVTFSDTTFDRTKMFDVPFGVTYGGGSILSACDTEEGVDISPDIETAEMKSDQSGLYDMRLVGAAMKATFTPVGITAANILALSKAQGSGVRRGAKMSTFAADLVVAGLVAGDPSITLHHAYCTKGGEMGSMERNLAGEFEFMTARKLTNGALSPLVTFGVVAS